MKFKVNENIHLTGWALTDLADGLGTWTVKGREHDLTLFATPFEDRHGADVGRVKNMAVSNFFQSYAAL
jgi:hypothetical protein